MRSDPGPRGDGKRRRRGVYAAIMGGGLGGGLALLLLALVVMTPTWTPLTNPLAAPAPTAPTPTAQGAALPTATTTSLPPLAASVAPDMSWPTYMGQSGRSGFNGAETTLTAATIAHLTVRRQLHAGGAIFAQPVVANGTIYWGAWDGYERATSVATGRNVWARYLGQTSVISCEGAVVGVSSTATLAYEPVDGRRTLVVFVGGGSGNFYALNAATGAVVWRTRLGQPPAAYLWSSPAYDAGAIYMGVASLGDCPLVQGRVVKLSAATGGVEATFNAVPNGCVGGTVWGSVAVDPNTGVVYVGTGNQGACAAAEPYADAVLALRASDLGLIGAWQAAAALAMFDSDFGSTPTLFTARIGGAMRHLVGIVNKNGTYYAFDAARISAGPLWTRQVSNPANCPACGDGGFAPGAWDGHLLYEPGGKTTVRGAPCPAGLFALNPANGAVVWSACYPGPTFATLAMGPGYLIIGAAPRLQVVSTQGPSVGHVLYSFHDPRAPSTYFWGAPSVADGMVVVGDADGNLFVLGR